MCICSMMPLHALYLHSLFLNCTFAQVLPNAGHENYTLKMAYTEHVCVLQVNLFVHRMSNLKGELLIVLNSVTLIFQTMSCTWLLAQRGVSVINHQSCAPDLRAKLINLSYNNQGAGSIHFQLSNESAN